jgi:hypothetical protein
MLLELQKGVWEPAPERVLTFSGPDPYSYPMFLSRSRQMKFSSKRFFPVIRIRAVERGFFDERTDKILEFYRYQFFLMFKSTQQ